MPGEQQGAQCAVAHLDDEQVCAAGDYPQPTIVLGWSSALNRVDAKQAVAALASR